MRRARRESLVGYLCLSPWLAGLLLLTLLPLAYSLYYSFTEWGIIGRPVWTGTRNYVRLFTADPWFYRALGITFRYILIAVPIGLACSFCLALLLHQRLAGRSVFRTIYFLPSITPVVAIALLWRWLLGENTGLVNQVLSTLHLPTPGWFDSPDTAMLSVALMSIWGGAGGVAMLTCLAGLESIPRELYEVAEIDGAGPVRRAFVVTVPMLSPILFYNLVTGVIFSFGIFNQIQALYRGNIGPNGACMTMMIFLYRQAFRIMRMGYGCAIGWVMAVAVFATVLLIFVVIGRRVYYAGETGSRY